MAYLNARSWRKAGVRSFGSGSRASWDHTAHRDCHDMAQEQKRCLQYEHMIPCLAVDCLEPRHPRMANWVHLRLLHLHQRVPLRGNAITAQHPYICATHRLLINNNPLLKHASKQMNKLLTRPRPWKHFQNPSHVPPRMIPATECEKN